MKKLFSTLMILAALPTMAAVQHLDDSRFEQVNSNGITVVDFYADWCGPCKQFSPVFEEASTQFGSEVVFIKVNADQSPKTLEKYGVRALPTIIVFKDGQEVRRKVGPADKQSLHSLINSANK